MTKKEKEISLNNLFTDNRTEDEAAYDFEYLTSKHRSPRTTEAYIRKCYRDRTLGSLLRRLDPIAFSASFTHKN
jgi:hypothetical protein